MPNGNYKNQTVEDTRYLIDLANQFLVSGKADYDNIAKFRAQIESIDASSKRIIVSQDVSSIAKANTPMEISRYPYTDPDEQFTITTSSAANISKNINRASIATGILRINGNETAKLTPGVKFTVVGGPNAGEYTVVSSTRNSGNTVIMVAEPVKSDTAGGTLTYKSTVITVSQDISDDLVNFVNETNNGDTKAYATHFASDSTNATKALENARAARDLLEAYKCNKYIGN